MLGFEGLQSLSVIGEVLSTPISRARSEVITRGCRFRRSNKVDPAPPGCDPVKPSRSQPGPHEYLHLRVVRVGHGPAQVKQRADHMLCDAHAAPARRARSHVLPKHAARLDRIDPTPSGRPPASLLVTTPEGLSYLVQRPLLHRPPMQRQPDRPGSEMSTRNHTPRQNNHDRTATSATVSPGPDHRMQCRRPRRQGATHLPLSSPVPYQHHPLADWAARTPATRAMRWSHLVYRRQTLRPGLDINARMNDSGGAPFPFDLHLGSEHDERVFVTKTRALSSPILCGLAPCHCSVSGRPLPQKPSLAHSASTIGTSFHQDPTDPRSHPTLGTSSAPSVNASDSVRHHQHAVHPLPPHERGDQSSVTRPCPIFQPLTVTRFSGHRQ